MIVLDYLLPFLLLLGVLIFFHELGHFAVAKWCGVKVEKFSLGFGPALLQRRVGETTYAISALPLGGFVKMLGELPGETLDPAERDRAFNFKPPWQRIAIALAGPGMNFVLPVFLMAWVAMVGFPQLTSLVSGIEPDSAAARAGLAPGDRIVAVDDRKVEWWHELEEAFAGGTHHALRLRIEREGEERVVELERRRNDEGPLAAGLTPNAPAAVVAVFPGTLAASSGLETGDRVVRVGQTEVRDRFALEAALAAAPAAPLEIEVVRQLARAEERRHVALRELPAERTLGALGLGAIDFRVARVDPLTPARSAGVREDDLIVAVDSTPVRSAHQVIEAIRSSEGKRVELGLLRAGERLDVVVEPALSPVPGPQGLETHYTIGVILGAPLVGGELRDLVLSNPLEALAFGASYSTEMLLATAQAFAELFKGRVGLGSLAGPIGIGAAAADTFAASWLDFVRLMVLISINLALLNLLPIPVLDGGTIVLTVAEWIRGGPLPARARDLAQTLGLSFILLLMGVAFWNDLWRMIRHLG
jgi:regulator of sigma E protease